MYLNNQPCSTCGKQLPTLFNIAKGSLLFTCADCKLKQIIDKMNFTDDDFYCKPRKEHPHNMTYTQGEPHGHFQTS
jgi:hypothetical protein